MRPALRQDRSRVPAALTAAAFLFSQVLFGYRPAVAAEVQRREAQRSFWAERRRAVEAAPIQLAMAGAAPFSALPRPGAVPPSIRPDISNSRLNRRGALPEWAKRIPFQLCEVSEVRRAGKSAPWVVLLQDLHQHEEAQRNIAGVLEALAKDGLPVGLEGASGPFDFSPLRDPAHPEAVKRAADHFLGKGWIGGAQYLGLTGQRPPRFLGLENLPLYESHIQAFLDTRPLLPQAEKDLKAREEQLRKEKESLFSPPLLALDRARGSFRAGKSSIKDYLAALTEMGGFRQETDVPLPRSRGRVRQSRGRGEKPYPPTPMGPSLARFARAIAQEEKLDIPQVEREREILLRALSQRATEGELRDLAALAASYRMGQSEPGDFYRALEDLCRKKETTQIPHPPLRDTFSQEEKETSRVFPLLSPRRGAFGAYLAYLETVEGIDRSELLNELLAYEDKVSQALIESPAQAALWKQSDQLSLTDKLIHQNLTSTEWEQYQALLPPPLRGRAGAGGDSLSPFEQFYTLAQSRDKALADNLLSSINKNDVTAHHPHPALRATFPLEGKENRGFPSPLAEKLTGAGLNVLALTPRVKELPEESSLAVFTKERTPLDKVLMGERLFLGMPLTVGNNKGVPPGQRERTEYMGVLVKAFASGLNQFHSTLENGKEIVVLLGENALQLFKINFPKYNLLDSGKDFVTLSKTPSIQFVSLAVLVVGATAVLAWLAPDLIALLSQDINGLKGLSGYAVALIMTLSAHETIVSSTSAKELMLEFLLIKLLGSVPPRR